MRRLSKTLIYFEHNLGKLINILRSHDTEQYHPEWLAKSKIALVKEGWLTKATMKTVDFYLMFKRRAASVQDFFQFKLPLNSCKKKELSHL